MRVPPILAVLAVVGSFLGSAPVSAGPSAPDQAPTARRPAGPAGGLLDRLPLGFEENRGQVHEEVLHRAHCRGYGAFLTADSVVLAASGDSVRMRFGGSEPQREGEPAGYANYLLGGDADARIPEIPRHRAVRYTTQTAGVSVVFRGDGARLAFDWHLAAGVPADGIRMTFEGAAEPRLDESGRLRLGSGRGEWVIGAPVAFHSVGELHLPCKAVFRLLPDGEIGFEVRGRDPALPLVIDPTIAYATYLGDTETEGYLSTAGATDDGSLIVAMSSSSEDYPVTVGAYQTVKGEDGSTNVRKDLCVTKLTPDGDDITWATFIGGETDEEAYGGAVDAAGNTYLAGWAWSDDYPLVNQHLGVQDADDFTAFLSKLDPTGTELLYSTRIRTGRPRDVDVDPDGNMYVVLGDTQPLVFKYSADGSELIYEYEMDVNFQQGFSALPFGIAVDADGNAYFVGEANNGVTGTAGRFPATQGAFQTEYGGGHKDAYVIKLDPDGETEWATLIGGTGRDAALGVDVDAAGAVYVGGRTGSSDFPIPEAGHQPDYAGGDDAFVVKIHPHGHALRWGTFLGGTSFESAMELLVHPCGTTHVVGFTNSGDFPVDDAFDSTLAGTRDAFLAQFDVSGALEYASYFGGTQSEIGQRVAVAPDGTTFGIAYCPSDDFDTTGDAVQEDYGGNVDTIVVAADSVFPEGFAPLVVLTSAALDATVDAPYEFEIGTEGGVDTIWTLLDGELPPGLTFDEDGVISGTPTEVGSTTFALEALGTCGIAKFETTLVVNPRPSGGANLSPWTSGEAYSGVLEPTGGTAPFEARYASGAMPPGLTLGEDGLLAGTLTAAGSYVFEIEFEDRWGALAEGTVRLLVNPPVSIDTTVLSPCTTGRPYAPGVDASGGTGALTWSVVTGVLPTAGPLDPAAATFGGNCVDPGTYQFTVRAMDTVGASAERPLTVVVNPHPSITTTGFPLAAASRSYEAALEGVQGTPPYLWSPVASALPPGYVLDQATGRISGTTAAGGRHALTFVLTDACGASTRASFFLDVATRVDLSSKKPREELTFGSGAALLARYVELLDGTTLSLKLRSQIKGLKELPLDLTLLGPDGDEIDLAAFLKRKSKSIDVKKLPIGETGRYLVLVERTGTFAGTVSLDVSAKAAKKWGGTVALDGSGTPVMLQVPVLSGTGLVLAFKPAKKSAAIPQVISVTAADGADLVASGKLKPKKKVTLKTTAVAGGVVTIVIANTSGVAGDVSWSAKLKPAGKGYPFEIDETP